VPAGFSLPPAGYAGGMTDSTQTQEHDEPNEFGFSGDATAPEPEPATGESFGESVAVPAGDLTGAVTAAIENATAGDDEDDRQG